MTKNRETEADNPAAQRGSRLRYDVVHAGYPPPPVSISARKLAELKRALGHTPSEPFLSTMAQVLASHIEYRSMVSKATPKKIGEKFSAAHAQARALLSTISGFSATETTLFYRGNDSLPVEEMLSLRELETMLYSFMARAETAINTVGTSKKQGAMPNYANRLLASRVAYALFQEAKSVPALTRGGTFDRVLRWALSFEEGSRQRRDVMDLMGQAVERSDKWGVGKLT